MTPIFFFGTLRDRALLETVLDRPVEADEMIPARASGHVARGLAGEAYPYLAERPGAAADGVLFHAAPGDLERIGWFEEAEYALAPIAVETASGTVEARYYRATTKARPSEEPWDFARWRSEARPVAIEAARELMAHYGHLAPEHIDEIWPGIMTRARMRARAKASAPPVRRLRGSHGAGDVELIATARPWTGYFALEELRLRHRLFDGGWSAPVSRTVLAVGDAVTVLPWDPGRDRVLLIEQFRPAMVSRGDPCPWGIEAVAGRLDQELDPAACARREAREEAGVDVGRLERVAAYYPTPGFAAEHITSFIGEADLGGAGGLYGVAREHEDIRAFTVTLDEALAAVAAGEIDNAPVILSLLWLAGNRMRLGDEWAPARRA